MNVESLIETIGSDFYTGVPDSQLKPLCDYLMNTWGIDRNHHLIGANEGNCAALAAGYHLATGKIPVVYMQNSGEGNIINPAASLLHEKVYGIPILYIIGWRGEPGVHDEPQHIHQGAVTLKLLEEMGIASFVIGQDTSEEALGQAMVRFRSLFAEGRGAAFVVRKGALSYHEKVVYKNQYSMTREGIIRHIVKISGKDPVVSTTGKASRELFETREDGCQGHQYDFLTVGSMGHTSSIALGVALNKSCQRVWCVDGDGAVLMHMGAMAVIGACQPENLIHIVINNEAHETVGGMPTAAGRADLTAIARACGYQNAVTVDNYEALDSALKTVGDSHTLSFIEAKCAIGARGDLGRPTTTAMDNKVSFMKYLASVT